MTGATICDFCSGPNPAWRYPATTFRDSFGSKSVEDWLACEACHAMIEAGDREGLIERAFRCPGIPQVVAMRVGSGRGTTSWISTSASAGTGAANRTGWRLEDRAMAGGDAT